jgi:hypothetical protein
MAQAGKVVAAIFVSFLLLYLAAIWTRWELSTISTGSRYAMFSLMAIVALLCSLGGVMADSMRRTRELLGSHKNPRHLHTRLHMPGR